MNPTSMNPYEKVMVFQRTANKQVSCVSRMEKLLTGFKELYRSQRNSIMAQVRIDILKEDYEESVSTESKLKAMVTPEEKLILPYFTGNCFDLYKKKNENVIQWFMAWIKEYETSLIHVGCSDLNFSYTEFLESEKMDAWFFDLLKDSITTEKLQSYVNVSIDVLSTKITCLGCRERYLLLACPLFWTLSITNKYHYMRKKGFCFNCLSQTHEVQNCTSTKRCTRCYGFHHTFLHVDKQPLAIGSSISPITIGVLLNTARVRVRPAFGSFKTIRAVLNFSSCVTQVSAVLAEKLQKCSKKTKNFLTNVCKAVEIYISPKDKAKPVFHVFAIVLSTTVNYQPPFRKTTLSTWHHIAGLKLADENPLRSGPIHLFIGMDVLCKVNRTAVRKGSQDQPVAEETLFGWVLNEPADPGSLSETTHQAIEDVAGPSSQQQYQEGQGVSNTTDTATVSRRKKCSRHALV